MNLKINTDVSLCTASAASCSCDSVVPTVARLPPPSSSGASTVRVVTYRPRFVHCCQQSVFCNSVDGIYRRGGRRVPGTTLQGCSLQAVLCVVCTSTTYYSSTGTVQTAVTGNRYTQFVLQERVLVLVLTNNTGTSTSLCSLPAVLVPVTPTVFYW